MTTDTRKVTDRRSLRFESAADLWRDVDELVRAERAGTHRCTGNWTLGQILGHLAYWAEAPYNGYPNMRTPPRIIRLMAPLFKKRFLHKSMPRGFRIPGAEAGTFGVDVLDADEGHRRMKAAFERLMREPPSHPNPVLGPLKHEEWIALNLRHCELHLGFAHPR